VEKIDKKFAKSNFRAKKREISLPDFESETIIAMDHDKDDLKVKMDAVSEKVKFISGTNAGTIVINLYVSGHGCMLPNDLNTYLFHGRI